jgi:hypothetical protein
LPEAWVAMAPVRASDPPWIRFPALRGVVDGERPWRLRVEGADGLLAGEVQVELENGSLPASVTIALAPSARLDVSLVTGAQVVDPTVALEPFAGGERLWMLPVAVQVLAGGGREVHFTRTAVPAGTYRVLVSIDAFDQQVDTVTLAAGEAANRTIDLGAIAASTRVEGELRSKSGTFREPTTVCIKDAAGKVLHREPVQWLEQGGEWIAPFAVDNLPSQVCELELLSMGSHRRWSTLPMHFVPPQTGLLLICDDTESLRMLCIRVLDANTGAPVDGWGGIALEGCETFAGMFGAKGSTTFFDVPVGALTGWYASAEGYVPRWGGLEAFVDDGKRLVADVALEPGWGARIRTVRAGTLPAEPLTGVAVLLDGQPAGITDAAGELVLVREAAPSRVEVHHEGWTYEGGDLDADTGVLEPYSAWKVLRFTQ